MFEYLLGLLEGMSAGELVVMVVVGGWLIKLAYGEYTKFKESSDTRAGDKIRQSDERKKILQDIIDLNTALTAFRNDTTDNIESLSRAVRALDEHGGQDRGRLLESVEQLKGVVLEYSTKVKGLESKITDMENQINLLFSSDKEYAYGYLVEAYQKYVVGSNAIGLVTLQNLENMYNTYISANPNNANDEFIAKIMKELRNLPTNNDRVL